MTTQTVRFRKECDHATIPTRAHDGDAGFDLHADIAFGVDVVIPPGQRQLVGTGVAVQLPAGTVGLVCPRSGLAAKHGVTVLNAPGIIDSGYRGELKVILLNHGDTDFRVAAGDRIAQLVIVPFLAPTVQVVDDFTDGELDGRGAGGFGSTGGFGQ